MKVLKHMTALFRPVTTDHFSVLVEPKQDALLGKYMSRYLESIYPELTESVRLRPAGRDQDRDHDDARLVQRPDDRPAVHPDRRRLHGHGRRPEQPEGSMKKPFNWARVLKHELVHVITLQQTGFNIPHWYTEALAVESEGFPRPQDWNKMLLTRVATRTKLLNLDTINLGFIRPKEPEERQLAYCQAQLYAQYMLQRFGPDALDQACSTPTDAASPPTAPSTTCFHGRSRPTSRRSYLTFLDGVVKTIRDAGRRREARRVLPALPPGRGQARRPRPERPDGLRALRPPRLQGGPPVRRQGPEAQGASSRSPATSRPVSSS